MSGFLVSFQTFSTVQVRYIKSSISLIQNDILRRKPDVKYDM